MDLVERRLEKRRKIKECVALSIREDKIQQTVGSEWIEYGGETFRLTVSLGGTLPFVELSGFNSDCEDYQFFNSFEEAKAEYDRLKIKYEVKK